MAQVNIDCCWYVGDEDCHKCLLKGLLFNCTNCPSYDDPHACDTAPAPVLKEPDRPHGEWVCKDTINGQALGFSCSNCKMPEYKISLFCPNCGARMSAKESDKP